MGSSGSGIYPFWSLGFVILKKLEGGFRIAFMDHTRDLALL